METVAGLGLAGMGRGVCRRLPIVLLPVVVALAATLVLGMVDGRQGYVATATLRLQPTGTSALVPYTPARPPTVEGLAATLSAFLETQGFALLLAERTGEPLWVGEEAGAGRTGTPPGTAVRHTRDGAAVRLTGRLVPRTAFYQITVQHPDPVRAVVLANATAELLAGPPGGDAGEAAAPAGAARDTPARLREELALAEARAATLRRQLQAFAALEAAGAERPAALAGESPTPLLQELRTLEEHRRTVLAALAAPPTAAADGAAAGIATVIDPAIRARPAALDRAVRLAPAVGLAALLGGLALALGLHALDGRAHDAADVAAVLDVPVVGRVPSLPVPAVAHAPPGSPVGHPVPGPTALHPGRAGQAPALALAAPAALPAAYRRLALHLAGDALPAGPALAAPAGSAPAGPCLAFLDVTSSHAGAGAPTVAAHLAVALAQEGRRVLLVDGCLHGPALPAPAGGAAPPGLAEALHAAVPAAPAGAAPLAHPAGDAPREGVGAADLASRPVLPASPGGDAGPVGGSVAVLPAGRAEALAAGRRALGAGAAQPVLAALAAGADVVLLAGPAALDTIDALLWARTATATYLCVRLAETRLADAVEACALLARAGGRVAGIVVVEAPPLVPPLLRRPPVPGPLPPPAPGPPPPPAGDGLLSVPPPSPHAAEGASSAGEGPAGRAASQVPEPAAPHPRGEARERPRARPLPAPDAPAVAAPRPPRAPPAGAGPVPAEVPAPAPSRPAADEPADRGAHAGAPGRRGRARGRRAGAGWQQVVGAIDAGVRRLLSTPPPDQA
jgi:Mrp family chromosome partitioning ATPase